MFGDHSGRVDGEVHDHVGAERLPQLHGGPDAPVVVLAGDQVGVLHVLRANAKDDPLSLVCPDSGASASDVVGQRQAKAAELHRQ